MACFGQPQALTLRLPSSSYIHCPSQCLCTFSRSSLSSQTSLKSSSAFSDFSCFKPSRFGGRKGLLIERDVYATIVAKRKRNIRIFAADSEAAPSGAERSSTSLVEQNTEGEEEEEDGSTFPTQLKYLTEEPPVEIDLRPWIIGGLAFVFIFHRAIWYFLKTSVLPLLNFTLNYFRRSAQLSLYVFIKQCLALAATVVTGSAWALLILRGIYAYIVDWVYAKAVFEALALSCIVLGIVEAVKPDAVSSQPYTLTVAALIGLGGLYGLFGSLIFVSLVSFLGIFSFLVMKQDILSATMPIAAVLAAFTDPPIRIGSILAILAIALYQNWRFPAKKTEVETRKAPSKPVTIMFIFSLLAGISASANWLYLRHLTWLSM